MKRLSKNHWIFLGATLMCFLLIIMIAYKGNAQSTQAAGNLAYGNDAQASSNIYLPLNLNKWLDIPPQKVVGTQNPSPTPSTPVPGLLIKGYVQLADGSGVPNVKIYRAFASYEGKIVAITEQGDGYYKADFQYIPGDETIRVWAELDGYIVEPAESRAGDDGIYDWRHYYGYEEKVLDFIAKPSGASPTPTATAYCRTNQQCSP